MLFRSTRGAFLDMTFEEAVFEGLAPDGGNSLSLPAPPLSLPSPSPLLPVPHHASRMAYLSRSLQLSL
jgi:hypothetical protein